MTNSEVREIELEFVYPEDFKDSYNFYIDIKNVAESYGVKLNCIVMNDEDTGRTYDYINN